MWVNGPFPCGVLPDIKIYKRDLKQKLLTSEIVLADKGYPDRTVNLPNVLDSHEVRKWNKWVGKRHETVNMHCKKWCVLKQVYQNSLENHKSIFRAIIVFTQLSIESGEPLFTL